MESDTNAPLDGGAPFIKMADATREQWRNVYMQFEPFARDLPHRVMTQMAMLRGGVHGFAVDRLEHCLQTATRAYRDRCDDEYVVCALVHDIGDLLCPYNHTEIATALLRHYVSDANLWMVEQHGLFQSYFYNHHLDLDPNGRDRYHGHPWFEHTAYFCEFYDQNSFDPAYQSMPLEAFEPMVHRVLGAPRITNPYSATSTPTS